MGAIKDLVDLVTQLTNNVQDRKFAAELREIQKMIADIQTEHAALHEQRIELMTENAELKQTIASLKEEIANSSIQESTHTNRIPEQAEKMLIFLASTRDRTTKDDAIHHAGLSTAKGDYFFDMLLKNEYVVRTSGQIGVGWFYAATSEGRKYLAENELLEQST